MLRMNNDLHLLSAYCMSKALHVPAHLNLTDFTDSYGVSCLFYKQGHREQGDEVTCPGHAEGSIQASLALGS